MLYVFVSDGVEESNWSRSLPHSLLETPDRKKSTLYPDIAFAQWLKITKLIYVTYLYKEQKKNKKVDTLMYYIDKSERILYFIIYIAVYISNL